MINEYQRTKDRVVIFIETRKEGTRKVLIDGEDLPKVFAYRKWRILRGHGDYVIANAWDAEGRPDHSKVVMLHRLVMNAPEHLECGFVNGDTFDCRKSNLFLGRHIDVMQDPNNLNRKSKSGAKNVYETRSSWAASKTIYGKPHYFGTYATKDEAEAAVRMGTVEAIRNALKQTDNAGTKDSTDEKPNK